MALINCHECKAQVSTDASSCPKCGAKVKKPTSKTTWVIGGFFALIIGIGIVNSGRAKEEAAQREAALTPEQRLSRDREAKESTHRFAAAQALVKAIRSSAKDPDSISIETLRVNTDATVLCVEYRGKNSFGALVKDYGVIANNKAYKTDAVKWNTYCKGELFDLKHAA